MYTLYDCQSAPSPRRARMFMVEKNIAFESIEVNLREGEHRREPYSSINPASTVPTLVCQNGTSFCENASIAAFLEAKHPSPALLGTTPLEKAAIAKWQWKAEFEGITAVSNALRNRSKSMVDRALPGPRKVPQIPELAERGLLQIAWFFETLDEQLCTNEFLAGPTYSIADITATVFVDFSRWVKVYPLSSQTHLLRWMQDMQRRDSYRA